MTKLAPERDIWSTSLAYPLQRESSTVKANTTAPVSYFSEVRQNYIALAREIQHLLVLGSVQTIPL